MPSPARPVHRNAAGAARGARDGPPAGRRASHCAATSTRREDGSARAAARPSTRLRGGRPKLMAMLELYLIRHGIAEDRGEDWPDDSKRPLTSEGLTKLRKEARGLVALSVTFDHSITSPLGRTRQTADALAEVLKGKPPIATSDALAPAGTPAAVIQEIGRHARKPRTALVGHE